MLLRALAAFILSHVDRGADVFAIDYAHQIVRVFQREYAHLRYFALMAQRECGYVHHVQLALYDLAIRYVDYRLGVGVDVGIGVEQRIDGRALEYRVGIDLSRAQRRRRVGRKVRIAGARREYYDAPLLQMAHRAPAYER